MTFHNSLAFTVDTAFVSRSDLQFSLQNALPSNSFSSDFFGTITLVCFHLFFFQVCPPKGRGSLQRPRPSKAASLGVLLPEDVDFVEPVHLLQHDERQNGVRAQSGKKRSRL
jgi:hypothetical protein